MSTNTNKPSSFYRLIGRNIALIISVMYLMLAVVETVCLLKGCSGHGSLGHGLSIIYQLQLCSAWGLIHYYERKFSI